MGSRRAAAGSATVRKGDARTIWRDSIYTSVSDSFSCVQLALHDTCLGVGRWCRNCPSLSVNLMMSIEAAARIGELGGLAPFRPSAALIGSMASLYCMSCVELPSLKEWTPQAATAKRAVRRGIRLQADHGSEFFVSWQSFADDEHFQHKTRCSQPHRPLVMFKIWDKIL